MMVELNDFQKTTEERLKGLIALRHGAGNFSIEGGPKDYAVRVTVGPYVSWIYPDGADITGQGIDKRFEIYDYDSLGALQAAYLTFVNGLLGRI